MKQTPIHTKYHKLIGARVLLDINGKCADQATINHLTNMDYIQRMVDDCAKLPRYVIQTELMKSLNTKTVMKSLETMIRADQGISHLPFDQVLVEFSESAELTDEGGQSRQSSVRHFIWLSELGEMNDLPKHVLRDPVTDKFAAVSWTLIDDVKDPAVVITPLIASCTLITNDYAKARNIPIKGPGSGTLIRCSIGPQVFEERLGKSLERQLISAYGLEHAFGPVNDALCAMMILLHTKGVVEDRIEVPAKLNKSRVSSGKAPIQDHVVVRIGHVYNRSGEEVKYIPGVSGRTMPVHWRSGHWRNQRWGTGYANTREVWIRPMLVNYVEGEVPTPKPKEITI